MTIQNLLIFLMLFNCLVLGACTNTGGAVPVAPLMVHVPYPERPEWVQYKADDFVHLSHAARQRLAQRHTQHLWYMQELENALKAYDTQLQD